MTPKSLVVAVFQALANIFGWSLHRSQTKNAPDIKERVERQKEIDAKAEFEKALRDRDIEKVRKGLAE